MIIKEYFDDKLLVRHYSDAGYKILQIETGIIYDEAIDQMPCLYTYLETEELIEPLEQDISEEISEEDIIEDIFEEEAP